ncbi:MAG: phospho-N-acetylmuramoyl-pentapeptide-transferase [Peptococcaceae bacterium]|nr:phospho-N-acetylmuramoyl-pentapeptide-transferase [Peptococcaceae bacterium]
MLALSIGIALVVSLALGPLLIPLLRRWKFGQTIREEGPRHHQSKAGTPTAGGIIMVIGVVMAVLICAWPPQLPAIICLVSFVSFALLGFIDDFIKITKRRNLGLTAQQKILGQFVFAGLVLFLAAMAGRGTVVEIPLLPNLFPSIPVSVDMGWFYYPFIAVLIVGMINAVNFTDGLDGLASGSVMISSGAFGFIALVNWNAGMYGDESWAVILFAGALMGACLGFLRFNSFPAKIFMGDCGSLGLGGALAAMAILTRTEFLFLLIGFVYVIEILSVVLQVISFKLRGKRIFRMSPLHHHFELGGWSEQKVVKTFWSWSLMAAAAGILLFVA